MSLRFFLFILSALFSVGIAFAATFEFSATPKSRIIVLTDMLNEPDDSQTMVRLLMYSNRVDIEGLIAVSSCHQYQGKNDEDIVRNDVQPQAIVERVKAYGLVCENLLQHAAGWPTEEYLLGIVGRGPSGYGMWDVGDGQTTTGSELIIKALLKEDPRPVYVCINAGANTLAQAIWDLKKRVDAVTFNACLEKLRVYDDAGQDNAGAWIASTYPQIRYWRSQDQVFNFMNRKGPITWGVELESGEGQHLWAMQNIMIGHGPLGALYPIRKQWQKPMKWHTIEGGGTSTWIGHINHGLWHSEEMTWGGWGGRFKSEKEKNVLALQLRWADLVETENEYKPFYMIREASDQWTDPVTGVQYKGAGVPIFRWRRAYQNDFEARMDWCVKGFSNANHNPIAVVNGDESNSFIHITANVGDQILLDGKASFDPDGDSLSFRWFCYPEAGSNPAILVSASDEASFEFTVPEDWSGETVHLIFEAKDQSEIVPLYDYRRVIVQSLE